jgi:hypothetical protein
MAGAVVPKEQDDADQDRNPTERNAELISILQQQQQQQQPPMQQCLSVEEE